MLSYRKSALNLLVVILLSTSLTYAQTTLQDSSVTIPLGGNAWRIDKDTLGGKISNDGIVDWSNQSAEFEAHCRIGKPGRFRVYLNFSVPEGITVISVFAAGRKFIVPAKAGINKERYVGEFTLVDTGYMRFLIRGLSKTGKVFANISGIKLIGEAVSHVSYVKNNDGDFFYWGRRGPSVHLGYQVPDDVNAEWFYNEVTVPKGNDVLGSYFMACGFGEGYFGMQVNSPTERHILFSVWSPFTTDDPKAIPDDQKIIMLKKGDGVHTGEFGNEGSGGHSHLVFPWKNGVTYKMLIGAKPAGDRTIYSCYYFAPENGKWNLMAVWDKTKTGGKLFSGLYSFVENFGSNGNDFFKAEYGNQWVCTPSGTWIELTKCHLTTTASPQKHQRYDYGAGVENNKFYMFTGGFKKLNNLSPGSVIERKPNGAHPDIDFSTLPEE